MLKQRVLTAIVLFIILGATVSVQSAWPFVVFLAVACACAGWEWIRLSSPRANFFAWFVGGALFTASIACAYAWIELDSKNYRVLISSVVLSVIIWVFVVIPTVMRGRAQAPARNMFWTAFAPVTLFATWAVLTYLYIHRGVLYVLSLLILVWIADIAAYFAGKAFGRRKLAPLISPGKTIEGAAAGLVGVVCWILISSNWPSSFGAQLVSQWTIWGAIFFAVCLGALSIIGDLFESLLKRRAGIKDSSNLLPGHGGVYDRIDAVVAVVPVAFFITELMTGTVVW